MEISGVHGNRIHKFDAGVGTLKVDYAATVIGQTDPTPVTEYDQSMYLRPSRYAEADKFYGFAATEFGNDHDSATLLEHVSSWVGTRLNYVPGSSDPIDGAVETLLSGKGVCRDFAHLVVALLRAVQVPARLVSVYAPGLAPMDFHAVAEAFVEGQWRAWWPHGPDLTAELPDLLSVLSVRLGPIGRVIYNMNEWATPPAKFTTAGRTVRLDGYRRQPINTVQVTGLNRDRIVLLVVSPDADPDQAHAIMMSAAGPSNVSTTESLLMVKQETDHQKVSS
nr:hypothetical protein MFLOJ_09430 [Mycobacterium florentinum]